MKIKKKTGVLILLAAGIFVYMAAVAAATGATAATATGVISADLPVRLYYFVKWEPLKQAAMGFPEGDFKTFEKAFQAAVIKEPEKAPRFERFDKSFSPVQEYGFFDGLVELIKSAIVRAEVGTVERFMKEVSDNRWIQGEEVSRNGGPFYVILTLPVSEKNEYQFRYQNRQTVEKEYKGASFTRALGRFKAVD